MFSQNLFLLSLSLLVGSISCWVNLYDQEFTYECPAQQFISHIKSIHDNRHEDRVFDFNCSHVNGDMHNCYWSAYANDFDQQLVFQCPHSGIITGISSYHSNHNEDRRYKFKCCEVKGMCLSNCHYSGFVNHYDGLLDYTVKSGYSLRGVISVHHNHEEDRIFDFEVCELTVCE